MTRLVTHTAGRSLEPSAGEGHLARALRIARPGLTLDCVELDSTLSWTGIDVPRHDSDFFVWAAGRDGSYDTIFGNPPYVALKSVGDSTKSAVGSLLAQYQGKTNLYHLFMHRCIELLRDGGELVFIVPAEWFFATSAAPLRALMERTGAVTDVVHCGEEKLFSDADVPAIMIFRFQRAATQGAVRYWSDFGKASQQQPAEKRELVAVDGRWLLLEKKTAKRVSGWTRLGEFFDVRVGLVSGADKVYKPDSVAGIEHECLLEQVTTSGRLEPFLYLENFDRFEDIPANAAGHIIRHKTELINRKIRRFDEGNWWRYGAIRNAAAMDSDTERFFALVKTRHPKPFFLVPGATHFSGGVLGVFKKPSAPCSCEEAVTLLNDSRYRVLFDSMLLSSNGKLSLQPATLADAPFPRSRAQLEAFLK